MRIECVGVSRVGSSKVNGDVFFISPDRKLILMADGASGAGEEGKVLMGRISILQRRYEWMIDRGIISSEQYEGYISNMHYMMWSCFENFIPMVVPQHRVEQFETRPGNLLLICSDGVSDWIDGDSLVAEIGMNCLDTALETIVSKAQERAIRKTGYSDDLTIVAIRWL